MRTNQLISCTAVTSLALLLALLSPVARAQENLVSQEAVDAANDRIQTWIPLGKYPVSIMVHILDGNSEVDAHICRKTGLFC